MNKKLLSLIISFTLLLSLLPTAGFAANGATLTVGTGHPYQYVSQALAAAQDGDTILITGDSVFFQPGQDQASGTPYVIDKAVTIKSESGTTLTANTAGIVLSADVSIQDLRLSYTAYTEINGIFANGHTLTISNMADGNNNDHPVRVFAGGLYQRGKWLGTPGAHGTVSLSGSQTVVGGVFACGLSAPGASESSWTIPCTVQITDKVTVSAGWTVTGINDGQLLQIMNHFPGENSADGSLKYARSIYAADTPAEIILHNTSVMDIDGESGSGVNAAVSIHPGQYLSSPGLYHVSSLTVNGGSVAPKALNSGCDLGVSSGAILNLSNVMNAGTTFDIQNFSGGGILQIPNLSTLAIRGTVTGQTEFRTNELSGRDHSGLVTLGHTYIQSPANTPDSAFTLTHPYSTQSDMYLTKDARGSWHVERAFAKDTDISITEVSLKDFTAPAAGDSPVYEFTPIYTTADSKVIEDSCFGFWYGGKETDAKGETLDETFLDGYTYRLELELTVPLADSGTACCFRPGLTLPKDFTLAQDIPAAGRYTIFIEKTFTLGTPTPTPPPGTGDNTGDSNDPQPEPTPPVNPSEIYTDVLPDAWYVPAVNFVVEQGLMTGLGGGKFAPDSSLTRAMLTQILYNKAGKPAVGLWDFTDVPPGDWYAAPVSWAAAQGIVLGFPNGQFKPNDNITREQLALILYRWADSPAVSDAALNFTDADQVSLWALDAICWAVDQGILSGKGGGILDPTGNATRGETAKMLMNFFQ